MFSLPLTKFKNETKIKTFFESKGTHSFHILHIGRIGSGCSRHCSSLFPQPLWLSSSKIMLWLLKRWWQGFHLYYNGLEQGSLHSVLEGRGPAEFSSNLPQHTCLEVSSILSKTLNSWFSCVWLGLELNSAGYWPSRNKFGDPWPRIYN